MLHSRAIFFGYCDTEKDIVGSFETEMDSNLVNLCFYQDQKLLQIFTSVKHLISDFLRPSFLFDFFFHYFSLVNDLQIPCAPVHMTHYEFHIITNMK